VAQVGHEVHADQDAGHLGGARPPEDAARAARWPASWSA